MDNTELAQPLAQSQIDAAARFWARGWETKEFARLKETFPDVADLVSIKALAVNELYRTRVFHIRKVAVVLEKILQETRATGPLLVEQLVDGIREVTGQNNHSFAAKFGHFFIDSNLPILDRYAEEMVAWHLPKKVWSQNPKRYLAFSADIEKLCELASLTSSCADLDAYLWVAGEYREWLKNRDSKQLDADLKECLDHASYCPLIHEMPSNRLG